MSKLDEYRNWCGGLGLGPQLAKYGPSLALASVCVNLLALALPLFLMQVYDRIIPNQSFGTLAWLAAGFCLALAFECVLRFCRTSLANLISSRLEHALSMLSAWRFVNSSITNFEEAGVGVHLNRYRAIGSLRSQLGGQTLQMAMDLPFTIIYLAGIFLIANSRIAMYPVLTSLTFLSVISFFRVYYLKLRKEQKSLLERRENFVIETLSGIHAIKAVSMEEKMLRRYEMLLGQIALNNKRVSFLTGLTPIVGSTFAQLTLFGVILLGGFLVMNGGLTLGGLIACSLLATRAFAPFQNLASFWMQSANRKIAKNQLRQIAGLPLDIDTDAKPLPSDISGKVCLEDVSYVPPQDSHPLLDKIDLKIQPKEMICITADTSAATTSLLLIMRGILKPSQGRVLLDDIDLSTLDQRNMRGKVEYLSDKPALFKGSIMDNLLLFDHGRLDNAQVACALTGLDEIVSQLPRGYETVVGNRSYEFLTGGTIQRIALARALVERPRILLFDNVDKFLDPSSKKVLHWLVGKLKGKCTLVIVSDNPEFLMQADATYQIRDGALFETTSAHATGKYRLQDQWRPVDDAGALQ